MQIIDWLNKNSGAMTFLITVVYVVATIAICQANIKSAKATREQLEVSKTQFEETKRLEFLPYLQFQQISSSQNEYKLKLVLCDKDIDGGTYVCCLNVQNIGRGTVKDIIYTYEWDDFSKKYDRGPFPIGGLMPSGNSNIRIEFALPKEQRNSVKCAFQLHFKDLLENEYNQRIEFHFESKNTAPMVLENYIVQSPIVINKE